MKITVYELVLVSLFSAIFAILGPMTLPIGPVPVTLINFALYISIYALGKKLSTISLLIYLLLGAVGLPVFSNYRGGLSVLLGETGGFLVGFLLTSIVSGFLIDKFYKNKLISFLSLLLGLIIQYLFGTLYFMFLTNTLSLFDILKICVFPFILLDTIKIIIAVFVGKKLKLILKSKKDF